MKATTLQQPNLHPLLANLIATLPIRPLVILPMINHQMHRSMPATFIINRTARETTFLRTCIQVILEHLRETRWLSFGICFAVLGDDHVDCIVAGSCTGLESAGASVVLDQGC